MLLSASIQNQTTLHEHNGSPNVSLNAIEQIPTQPASLIPAIRLNTPQEFSQNNELSVEEPPTLTEESTGQKRKSLFSSLKLSLKGNIAISMNTEHLTQKLQKRQRRRRGSVDVEATDSLLVVNGVNIEGDACRSAKIVNSNQKPLFDSRSQQQTEGSRFWSTQDNSQSSPDGRHAPIHLNETEQFQNDESSQDQQDRKNNGLEGFEADYEFGERLGEGAHGYVRLCKRRKNDQAFCVKVEKMEEEQIQGLRQNFISIKALKHQNIVRYRSMYFCEKKSVCYLVMDRCDGQPLAYQKHRSEDKLKVIFSSLLAALTYSHSRFICHRDIKPENVLYDEESGKVTLVDFGVGKSMIRRGRLQKMMTPTGTMFYKAPEIFLGGGYDQKVDMWALGCSLYQMATGKTPFESEYISDFINNAQTKEPPFNEPEWADYSNLLRNFISGLLMKNPNKRMDAMQASKHIWFDAKIPNLGQESQLRESWTHLTETKKTQGRFKLRLRKDISWAEDAHTHSGGFESLKADDANQYQSLVSSMTSSGLLVEGNTSRVNAAAAASRFAKQLNYPKRNLFDLVESDEEGETNAQDSRIKSAVANINRVRTKDSIEKDQKSGFREIPNHLQTLKQVSPDALYDPSQQSSPAKTSLLNARGDGLGCNKQQQAIGRAQESKRISDDEELLDDGAFPEHLMND